MKKLIFLIGVLLFSIAARASEPKALTQFFGPNGIKDKAVMYHGEMIDYYIDKPTLGESLPKGTQVSFRTLNKSKTRAVYAVLLSQGENTQDWYAFLEKVDDSWKLSAIRGLALPGIFFMALQEMEKKSVRSKEEEWQYQNMLLTIKSDSELRTYLKDNVVKFNNIMKLLMKRDTTAAEEIAKSLFINISNDEGGITEFSIGGILDNSVGYLFVPKGKRPPAMNSSNYIYIEQVIDGWYIYKTT